MAYVFGLQTLQLKDFSKFYWLKGQKLKNKGHANFYECCDLTKKVYLLNFTPITAGSNLLLLFYLCTAPPHLPNKMLILDALIWLTGAVGWAGDHSRIGSCCLCKSLLLGSCTININVALLWSFPEVYHLRIIKTEI